MRAHTPDYFRLSAALSQVLARMDTKPETLDEAVEAVTGSDPEFAPRLKAFARGEYDEPGVCEHGYAYGCRACDPDGLITRSSRYEN